jgi:hypothetical protein
MWGEIFISIRKIPLRRYFDRFHLFGHRAARPFFIPKFISLIGFLSAFVDFLYADTLISRIFAENFKNYEYE